MSISEVFENFGNLFSGAYNRNKQHFVVQAFLFVFMYHMSFVICCLLTAQTSEVFENFGSLRCHIKKIHFFDRSSVPLRFSFGSCSVLSEAGPKKGRTWYEGITKEIRRKRYEEIDIMSFFQIKDGLSGLCIEKASKTMICAVVFAKVSETKTIFFNY
jgi:hypothetical protein